PALHSFPTRRSSDLAVVLPGVGAFGEAVRRLTAQGLMSVLRETVSSGKPFLGICLGLQLLFEGSEESPGVKGLGIFKGRVKRFRDRKSTRLNSSHLV